ncbi:terpene synthase family protein [Streptomyces sp. NPDC001401]|uniref:terpene synthase family protein n=1 Tax=Streptomyces sp. NPDC001401 TaxID=3364570 RepID=UPI00369A98B8
MPTLELDVPFALRTNPRLEKALPGHVQRLWSFGLPEKVYLAQRCPDIVGGWWPEAHGDDLDLGLDFFAWLFLVDDAFDGLNKQDAEKLIKTFTGVVEGAGGNGDSRVDFFADVWARQCKGMSARYCRRAADNWTKVFDALLTEVVNMSEGHFPTIEEYRSIRYRSGYMPPILDMTERLRGFELTPEVYADPVFQTLYDANVWCLNLVDDLFSFEKEAAQGEPHNMVLVVERERGCSRSEAVDAVVSMLGDHLADFLTAEARLSAALEARGVSLTDRANTYAFVDDLRSSCASSYYWCRSSPRYTGEMEWLSFRDD